MELAEHCRQCIVRSRDGNIEVEAGHTIARVQWCAWQQVVPGTTLSTLYPLLGVTPCDRAGLGWAGLGWAGLATQERGNERRRSLSRFISGL